jgi:hypothetical protein
MSHLLLLADIFQFGIFPGRKLVQLNRLGNLSMTLVHLLLRLRLRQMTRRSGNRLSKSLKND